MGDDVTLRILNCKNLGVKASRFCGSVKKENSADLIKSGFDVLVCGSSTIFRPQDGPLSETIKTYRSAVNKSLGVV